LNTYPRFCFLRSDPSK